MIRAKRSELQHGVIDSYIGGLLIASSSWITKDMKFGCLIIGQSLVFLRWSSRLYYRKKRAMKWDECQKKLLELKEKLGNQSRLDYLNNFLGFDAGMSKKLLLQKEKDR